MKKLFNGILLKKKQKNLLTYITLFYHLSFYFLIMLHINDFNSSLFRQGLVLLTKPQKSRKGREGSVRSSPVNSYRYERELNRTGTVGDILSQMWGRRCRAKQVEDTSWSPKDGFDTAHSTGREGRKRLRCDEINTSRGKRFLLRMLAERHSDCWKGEGKYIYICLVFAAITGRFEPWAEPTIMICA